MGNLGNPAMSVIKPQFATSLLFLLATPRQIVAANEHDPLFYVIRLDIGDRINSVWLHTGPELDGPNLLLDQ